MQAGASDFPTDDVPFLAAGAVTSGTNYFSAAYRLSDESFMKPVSFISDLKIRASYGISGNNLIPNYASQGLLGISRNVSNGQVISGVVPSSLANMVLTWEQSVQTNIGLDLSLFQNRHGTYGSF